MTVLDASALLAFARRERGADQVSEVLSSAHVSVVNASEFIQKLNQYGSPGQLAFEKLEQIGLTLHGATREDAFAASSIWPITRPHGLSLADRFCLVLAQRLEGPVLTADGSWLPLAGELGLEIQLIR